MDGGVGTLAFSDSDERSTAWTFEGFGHGSNALLLAGALKLVGSDGDTAKLGKMGRVNGLVALGCLSKRLIRFKLEEEREESVSMRSAAQEPQKLESRPMVST